MQRERNALASLRVPPKVFLTTSSGIRREVFNALESCQAAEQRSDTERGQARSLRSDTKRGQIRNAWHVSEVQSPDKRFYRRRVSIPDCGNFFERDAAWWCDSCGRRGAGDRRMLLLCEKQRLQCSLGIARHLEHNRTSDLDMPERPHCYMCAVKCGIQVPELFWRNGVFRRLARWAEGAVPALRADVCHPCQQLLALEAY